MSVPPSAISSVVPFSATDITLLIGSVSASIVGIIAGIRMSRCTRVRLCHCVEVDRELPKTPPNTPANTPTMSESASLEEIKLEDSTLNV
jgi:hypothetical protein